MLEIGSCSCNVQSPRNKVHTRFPSSTFIQTEHLQNIDVSWGHEPKIRKALEIKECMFRFMERQFQRNWRLQWHRMESAVGLISVVASHRVHNFALMGLGPGRRTCHNVSFAGPDS